MAATDISTSLAHLSDAIGALAQNNTDAAKLLLQLCTQVCVCVCVCVGVCGCVCGCEKDDLKKQTGRETIYIKSYNKS